MKVRIKNPIYGVPVTFLIKLNLEKIDIIKFINGNKASINGKKWFPQIFDQKEIKLWKNIKIMLKRQFLEK